jgi:cytochrome c oxidase subunit IV
MSAVTHSPEDKRKTYWKVFYILTALTIFEVVIVQAPLPKLAVTLMVVVASLSKAFAVGWIYMHLNHETKGLKIILLFPLFVAFFYAVFLIVDAKLQVRRHSNVYVGETKRFWGQRNLEDRQVDEFGNAIVPEAKKDPPAGGHESKNEVHEEAHSK